MEKDHKEEIHSNRWSMKQLNAKRLIADPVGDEVIAKIMTGDDRSILNNLFDALQKNSDTVPESSPDFIKEYFALKTNLPEWADQKKIALGQKFFLEYGSEISMMLFCKSLPQCYACKKGAQVMYKTERFVEKNGSFDTFTKRLVETAQFVVNIMSPGGFSPEGNGIITTQKVRLIHSTIRYYIKKEQWDVEELGEPINQEDLVGTLMAFGPLVLEGLKKLSIDIPQDVEDAYVHCWKIAGYIVGVDDDLLPNNANEGLELGLKIFDSQIEYSQEGEELINSLISFMEYVIPGNRFDHIAPFLLRFLLDDTVANTMKIPDSDKFMESLFTRFTGIVFKTKAEMLDHTILAPKLYAVFNKVFLRGVLSYYNEYGKIHFHLPKSLTKNWNLNESWEDVTSTTSLFGYRATIQRKK
jgi:hypothetical protein